MRSWVPFVLLAALLVAVPVHAAEDQKLAPIRLDPVALDRAYRRARAKRNIGIALAVPGVASTMLGLVLVVYGLNQEPAIFSEVAELVAGGFTIVAGAAIAAPGLGLWMTAQDDMDVVKWRRQQVLPFASLRSGGGVAGLTIRF
jgi:hypothetical protein